MTSEEMKTLEQVIQHVKRLDKRMLSLEQTVGSGLMGTVILLELVTTALDSSVDSPARDRALADAQKTLRAMRQGFGGGRDGA